jgi:sortase A
MTAIDEKLAAIETRPRRSRARRVVRLVSNVLIVAGLVALVWSFAVWRWGDPVSALYTSWQQRHLAGDYSESVRAFERSAPKVVQAARAPSATPAEIERAAKLFHRKLTPGTAIGKIRVPELGLKMVLVAGTDSTSLRKGPGWDARTFLPGEGELVYVAGHRTTFKAPFAHIDRLEAGDRVMLDLPYGTFMYRVTRSVIVPATDIRRLESQGREEVALQACHPRFSAKERYIVYARPVQRPA